MLRFVRYGEYLNSSPTVEGLGAQLFNIKLRTRQILCSLAGQKCLL